MNSLRARDEHLAKMSDRAVAEFEAARGTPREAAAFREVERNRDLLKAAKAEADALASIKSAQGRNHTRTP